MRIERLIRASRWHAAFLLSALLLACFAQGGAHASPSHGPLIFEDTFNGPLNRAVWNPFMTDNAADGAPWEYVYGQPNPSGSTGYPNPKGFNADYDLPAQVHSGVPGVGLELALTKGSDAKGYDWTGSVICSYPNTRYFKTKGFTFDAAYIEVCAKMPGDLDCGGWPAIWFLPAKESHGYPIDLIEGGFTKGDVKPDRVMATTLNYFNANGSDSQVHTDTGVDLASGYHTYALAYKSGKFIRCYFDGKLVASWTKHVSTGSYFVVICNALGNSKSVGWRSQISSATPPSDPMYVKYVRAYKLQ
jgi:hypothetical protein